MAARVDRPAYGGAYVGTCHRRERRTPRRTDRVRRGVRSCSRPVPHERPGEQG
ncbi:hypothetical protein [Micromonospora sp. SH-82]|uniref:hypothetical protein n=1 Tax=Micromonospora sp. SH-82 TaxID=3132938 RepID=UPI003EBEC6DB